jgi:hypothetical protein
MCPPGRLGHHFGCEARSPRGGASVPNLPTALYGAVRTRPREPPNPRPICGLDGAAVAAAVMAGAYRKCPLPVSTARGTTTNGPKARPRVRSGGGNGSRDDTRGGQPLLPPPPSRRIVAVRRGDPLILGGLLGRPADGEVDPVGGDDDHKPSGPEEPSGQDVGEPVVTRENRLRLLVNAKAPAVAMVGIRAPRVLAQREVSDRGRGGKARSVMRVCARREGLRPPGVGGCGQ